MNYEELLKKHLLKCYNTSLVDDYVSFDDIVTVWFSKQLQNAKGLFFVKGINNTYVEVTFDGDKKVAYVDIYYKTSNEEISLDD